MKKLLTALAILAIMAVCFVLLPTEAQAVDGAGRIGDCTWVLEGTTLTISGNGRMGIEGSGSLQPWGQNVTHVIIEEGVTHISPEAFMRCPLEYVSIASTVRSIGDDAFKLSGLTSIIIPEGVTGIGEGAFCFCYSLSDVKLPRTLTSIGRWAFQNCAMKSIVLPASVTRIANYAFNYCNIEDVWFLGSESDKASLSIGGDNLCLNTATWHYNSCPLGAPHAYNGICDNSCNGCGEIREVPDHSYDSACDNCCNGCGELRTVPDHIYDNACDAECNVCRYIRNVSHRYGTEWVMTKTDHWHECSSCGDKKDITTHNYTNACDLDCNICGYGRAVTHSYESTWSANAASHWHECSVCKDKQDLDAHNPGAAATETTAQLCTTCGYIIKPALNHTHNYASTWTMNDSGHWHACSGCSEKGNYDTHNWNDNYCTVCGANNPNATQPATQPTEGASSSTEPVTQPSADPTTPSGTDVPTTPDTTDTSDPGGSTPSLTEPNGSSENTSGAVWIIISVAVVFLGGGGIAGWFFWKKKH